MPDMPQGGPPAAAPGPSPAPGGGAPPPDQGDGGGIGQAIITVDQTLNKITQAVTQNPQLQDDVKKAFSDALTAFRGASQLLVKAAGGGGESEPDGDEAGGATSPEQGGAGGAVPMTHAPMRGG